jgi:hypothetical protein
MNGLLVFLALGGYVLAIAIAVVAWDFIAKLKGWWRR